MYGLLLSLLIIFVGICCTYSKVRVTFLQKPTLLLPCQFHKRAGKSCIHMGFANRDFHFTKWFTKIISLLPHSVHFYHYEIANLHGIIRLRVVVAVYQLNKTVRWCAWFLSILLLRKTVIFPIRGANSWTFSLILNHKTMDSWASSMCISVKMTCLQFIC